MIGSNELELNHDEVCKAIEYYLNNSVFMRDVIVTQLRANTESYGAGKDGIIIYRVKMNIKFVDEETAKLE